MQLKTGVVGHAGDIEVRKGEDQLVAELSEQYGIPSISLERYEIKPEVLQIFSKESAIKHRMFPVSLNDRSMLVAVCDPSDIFAIDYLKFSTGLDIKVTVASERAVKEAINKYYVLQQESDEIVETRKNEEEINRMIDDLTEFDLEYGISEDVDIDDSEETSYEDAPIIKLVNFLLTDALRKNASDIHIEPYEKLLRVRYRIDGTLYDMLQPPFKIRNAVSSRVKIMANLDIAERRLPQDGRIKLRIAGGKTIEYRVSVVPTIYGEKVVLRVLDKGQLQFDLTRLGFEEQQLIKFRDSIFKPYGMVLITGPTGSGKTTTLYSSLIELNKVDVNISTAEDPVEYSLDGVNQIQVREDIGLTFASCLRSFLRQDPDIILVGEIRDYETAEISIKSALTGHLVLSTLHTNDSSSTVARLLNIGIEPFLVAASLNSIVAQRLIRVICSDCKQKIDVAPQVLIDLGVSPKEVEQFKIYQGKGCKNCSGIGYKGRIAIYEVMTITEELKEFILNGASVPEMKREAMRQGMKTLRQSAIEKLKLGLTTIEEVVENSVSDN